MTTIIILLILAGITIASLTSTGLFKVAQDAKSKIEEKAEEENATWVHNLTLTELNETRNKTSQEDTTSTATTDAATGLFNLRTLNKYSYNGSASANYWLASPNSGDTYNLRFVNSDGRISNDSCNTIGVRPVVSIPISNFNLHKVTTQ